MDGFSSGFPLVSQEQRARATLGIAGARGAQRGELHAQQRAAVFRGFTVTAFGVAAGGAIQSRENENLLNVS